MAVWDKIGSRGNVDDRRGAPASLAWGGGGVSVVGLVIILLLNYASDGNINDVLGELEQIQTPAVQSPLTTKDFEGADDYEVFASTVLGSNNDLWSKIFAQNNLTYVPPKLVLFRQATQSGCGIANSQSGPHYCPPDETIYLDETFFNELQARFKAKGGDVAEAYVIAHEVGHHVQNQLGLRAAGSNEDSIKVELQADCFAGLWANSIRDAGVFEPGEINEALDAAAAVGDDRIQKEITGQVRPEIWTHGSAEQRMQWFNRGFEGGSLSKCDTFQN